MLKARSEADEWFLAQVVETEIDQIGGEEKEQEKKSWKPPKDGWLMCNVAFEWKKDSKLFGGAWVVRNHRGIVISHSRRAFSGVASLENARFIALLWAFESMTSMHYEKVIFAGDFKELFLALLKPNDWPALRFQIDELRRELSGMNEHHFQHVTIEENRGASIIAQSVTRQNRMQSYVANGHPVWLFELFVNESRLL